MQRYATASGNAGINNGLVSGPSGREAVRAEPSFPTPSFPLNSRRQQQVAPYRLKCDKETLNSRLGPPDFYPQTTNCPEETLTRDYLQSGYKETVEGIEEAREIVLTQTSYFTKADILLKCKEAIRKRFRAINDSRTQKRKAGQVYGVPLSGSLLSKPGVFPEQRQYSEESRRKWVEALGQPHRRLCSLSENVPHVYRRKALIDLLIRQNIPYLRATWLVKISYLNQVPPTPSSLSTGSPDKSQVARSELWTKDVIEYLHQLLDEFYLKDGCLPSTSGRDQPSPGLVTGSVPGKNKSESSPTMVETEEPHLFFKWRYMSCLIQWHLAEGLLLPSPLIEWMLNQLQEKDPSKVLELLLPILTSMIDILTLSQMYVRMFVEVALRFLGDVSPSSLDSIDSVEKALTASAIVDMLRYMILAVPDTFVSIDCFPLPSCVSPDMYWRINLQKAPEAGVYASYNGQNKTRYLSCGYAVLSIRKRASQLTKLVNPGLQGHGAAKVLQSLDKSLTTGNLKTAYTSLFEDLSDSIMEQSWIAEVSPCLLSSLAWIGTIELSLISSVFFLCEWATCDYRDCRYASSQTLKLTGRKDFSQVYLTVSILKNKRDEMNSLRRSKTTYQCAANNPTKNVPIADASLSAAVVDDSSGMKSSGRNGTERKHKRNVFESPGPLHDIIVCWLDQHEVGTAAGSTRVDVLIIELTRCGIFYPQSYVRQLIVSGLACRNESPFDLERQRRHRRMLKQLPGSCLFDILEEAKVAEGPILYEIIRTYAGERQLVLEDLSGGHTMVTGHNSKFSDTKTIDHQPPASDGKHDNVNVHVAEVKSLVSKLLHFPNVSVGNGPPFDALETNLRQASSIELKVDFQELSALSEGHVHRTKKQKLDEQNSIFRGLSLTKYGDGDTWWLGKGQQLQEQLQVETPQKSTKQTSRARRKTQSLSQLAAARIDSSQGASTSHVCDSKLSCSHHKSAKLGENHKDLDCLCVKFSGFTKVLKRLRLAERRSISSWLLNSVKKFVEGNEALASKLTSSVGAFSSEPDAKTVKWKLGEDELLLIIYILDTSYDLLSAVRLIIWLLHKVRAGSNQSQMGKSMILPKNREHQICQVGETFLLSCLQRYENVLLATDLVPEVLAAAVNKNIGLVMSNGRYSGSATFAYARYFLKKYREVASVARWERSFRAAGDQRLLAELDNGRSVDGDLITSSRISAGGEIDEHIRQKLGSRMSRSLALPSMKEIVHRQVEEASNYICGKDRKVLSSSGGLEKWEDSYQVAHDIVFGAFGLMDCIRQNGASPDGDPSIVAVAVSAIIVNVGPAVAKLIDFASANGQGLGDANTLKWVRHILDIHVTSLCLLKEALGERFTRVFEIVLAAESSSALSNALAPPKTHRTQFQRSPEGNDMFGNHANEQANSFPKAAGARATKFVAAISALLVGTIVHGVVSLERMVSAIKLKDGLDVLQFLRSSKSSTNGISRSGGGFKPDVCTELYVHLFRLLLGNCKTLCDGLIAELLGEPYILALSRMQRILPLSLVFPPAYSVFSMVIWQPYIFHRTVSSRDDNQLYQSLLLAITDSMLHHPFRDIFFRNTQDLYNLLVADVGDSEFSFLLGLHNPEKHSKAVPYIPLRARQFLNALVDCKIPAFSAMHEDNMGFPELGETKETEYEAKLSERLIQVLDTLQPAKFHWQWVELRLLLNELALCEKIRTQPFAEALKSLSPNADNSLSETEKGLSNIILSRLLVRPDAASLYSEVVHLLGKPLQESFVTDVKWILHGQDVLLGRKSMRQQLLHVAQRKRLPMKAQIWKPWGWSNFVSDTTNSGSARKKSEVASIEEGELVDECSGNTKSSKNSSEGTDSEGSGMISQYVTEKALIELMLPCIDRCSNDLRNLFAGELIKQMQGIEQQINGKLRNGGVKLAGAVSSGIQGTTNKNSSRKGGRGGNPQSEKRPASAIDSTPPSSAAIRASLWLRLQFVIRLLPVIFADREPTPRNMRQMLAPIILRLLGTRLVYENADAFPPVNSSTMWRDAEHLLEHSADAMTDRAENTLFDTLCCVLHALLGCCKPSWLKAKSMPKLTGKSQRDLPPFDREALESLQLELDRMELPDTIRRRIQVAMPSLPPLRSLPAPCVSFQPSALSPLQSGAVSTNGSHQRTSPANWAPTNLPAKSKVAASVPFQDPYMEIDPWTMLEDGTGSGSVKAGSGSTAGPTADHSTLKACSWLKGSVRMRRTDPTYVSSQDDDS